MKKSRASKSKPSALAALDQTFDCCRRIETLAHLLETCDRLEKHYALNPHLIGHAGFMIAEETTRLRRWLGKVARVH